MADGTAIEWTDATWNPITGCSVVSPGCTNCYAMRLAGTRLKRTPSRAGLTVDGKAGPVWNGQVRLNEQWLFQPLRWKRPRRIFVCAHGDLFAENVPDEWIDRVFAVMALAPQHTFQVLTKRASRMRSYLSGFECDGARRLNVAYAAGRLMEDGDNAHDEVANAAWPLPNVWLGVSAEDQTRADERVPELLATPAAVRFVSAEPLLGKIDFVRITHRAPDTFKWLASVSARLNALTGNYPLEEHDGEPHPDRLHWIIVGGESGPGARPMHPDWARAIRDQCAAAGTAFFFKQWGAWAPNVGAVDWWNIDDDPEQSKFSHREWKDGRWSDPFYPMWFDWEDGNHDQEQSVSLIGKKAAGRLLDSVEHSDFPEIREVPFR